MQPTILVAINRGERVYFVLDDYALHVMHIENA